MYVCVRCVCVCVWEKNSAESVELCKCQKCVNQKQNRKTSENGEEQLANTLGIIDWLTLGLNVLTLIYPTLLFLDHKGCLQNELPASFLSGFKL